MIKSILGGALVIARVLMVIGIATVVTACEQPAASPPASSEPAAQLTEQTPTDYAAASPRTLTRVEFSSLVAGQTKATIRERLGPPSNVEVANYDNRESWYYWDDKIRIYDEEAGTFIRSNARVTFSISSGAVVDAAP